jgi:hypothetical protein
MSKEPEIEHDYHAGKDKLTITIHRYFLESKNTRDAILEKLMANLESKPDRLIADAKGKIKKGTGQKAAWSTKGIQTDCDWRLNAARKCLTSV